MEKKNKNKKKKSSALALSLSMLVGVVFGVIMAEYGSRLPDVPGLGFASFAFMVLAIFAQIAIHEAGILCSGLRRDINSARFGFSGLWYKKATADLFSSALSLPAPADNACSSRPN